MNPSPPREKRRFTRIHFDATAVVEGGVRPAEVELIDISLKGALVTEPEDDSLPDSGRATLKIRGPGDAFRITARVRRVGRRSGTVAFVITEIDLDSMTHLRRMIELNAGDESMLHRELSALGDADCGQDE